MARPLRLEYPGAIYHVTVRMLGSWRRQRDLLFEDDSDRERFVARLGERVERFNVRLYLFCMLDNHFHLVCETPGGNVSRFMQSLNTAYTVYFNLRHGRHGHLVDGRFKAKVVGGDRYLLALSRYVHLNPVRVSAAAKLTTAEKRRRLREYSWSTYPSYIGRRPPFDFVDYGPMLALMSGSSRARSRSYREFVETGLARNDTEFEAILKESPRSIGDDSFHAWVAEQYRELVEGRNHPEDVAFRRTTEPLSADAVLAVAARSLGVDVDEFRRHRRDATYRSIAARTLVRYAGLTQREVAEQLGLDSGAAVSVRLRALAERLAEDDELRRRIERLDKAVGRLSGPNA